MSDLKILRDENMLPIIIDALVKTAERMEHVTVDTENIIKTLTNGLSSSQRDTKKAVEQLCTEIKDLKTEIGKLRGLIDTKMDMNKILATLNSEKEQTAQERIKAEQNKQTEQIKAEKEKYKIKFAFWTKLVSLLLGSGGVALLILKALFGVP